MGDPPQMIGARRLRELLDAHGVTPRKSLGQNFVVDPNTIRKVVRAADLRPEDRVLEIGAGAGSLTLGLASASAHVTALETDVRLLPVLEDVLSDVNNVDVVVADALEADLSSIDATRLVANLPYNIAAQMVLRVLEDAPRIETIVVMTQREVGVRLAAGPGSREYGLTSVLVAYWGRASVAGSVSRNAFYPAPNVDSALVRIVRGAPPEVERRALYAVARAAFSQRRKSLRNSLAALAGGTTAAAAALEGAGVPPSARAEELGLDGFVALARELAYTLHGPPQSRRST